jgi:hypothetical protein
MDIPSFGLYINTLETACVILDTTLDILVLISNPAFEATHGRLGIRIGQNISCL